MSFVRKSAMDHLRRWLPAVVLLSVCGYALWRTGVHVSSGRWIQSGLFGLMLVVFAALSHRAVLTAILPSAGPGEFRTDEGAIAYFAAGGGWVTSLDNITALSIADGNWVIAQDDGPILSAPADAARSDDLVDAFAQLPGLQFSRITAALARGGSVLIWERTPNRERLPPTKV